MSWTIRSAAAADAPGLAVVYGHHVLHGVGTFEEVPPSADEMGQRLAAVQQRGLPYLVAEDNGAVVGLAYAGPFRLRAAYRYMVEDSVYVAASHQGRVVVNHHRPMLRAVLLDPTIQRINALFTLQCSQPFRGRWRPLRQAGRRMAGSSHHH